MYFYQNNCDVVVLEVGLGGRFDSTNVIKNPLVSVICSISLDHTAQLGDTVDKIAFEKAGIIKENCESVLYPVQEEEVFKVIEDVAIKKHSNLTIAKNERISIVDRHINGDIIRFNRSYCD